MFRKMTAFFVCLSLFGSVVGLGEAAGENGKKSYGTWIKDVSPVKSMPVAEEKEAKGTLPAPLKEEAVSYKIVINIPARSLGLYKNNERFRLYPVGLGKISTPTPVGYFSVLTKEENPTWVDPGDSRNTIPSGASNPLGYRWMQVWGNYGIHGTNRPESIGNFVSNGCIRMRETDVEEVYDYVSVGTPVEIMYQRVVIDKIKDNMIVYYIYPDGYGYQPLDVEVVTKWLAGYGVEKFEADEDIEKKIRLADGQPTYVARAYSLSINGKNLNDKAIIKDDIVYLPVEKIAEQTKVALTWDSDSATLTSPYGKAIGYDKKNTLFFNAEDASVLFHLEGGFSKKGIYELSTIKSKTEEPSEKISGKTEAVDMQDRHTVNNGSTIVNREGRTAKTNSSQQDRS